MTYKMKYIFFAFVLLSIINKVNATDISDQSHLTLKYALEHGTARIQALPKASKALFNRYEVVLDGPRKLKQKNRRITGITENFYLIDMRKSEIEDMKKFSRSIKIPRKIGFWLDFSEQDIDDFLMNRTVCVEKQDASIKQISFVSDMDHR